MWLPATIFMWAMMTTESTARICGDGDVCEAIVFNQLALLEVKEEIKRLVAAYNKTTERGDLLLQSDLAACKTEKQELMDQIKSLESKYKATTMVRDEATDEVDELRREVGELRSLKEQLQSDKSKLQEEIIKSRERNRNLTLMAQKPMDCADVQMKGLTASGVYTIYPYQTEASIEVVCDLESDEGGWTVFLNRQLQDEPLDFNESWEEFKKGFGNVNTEYWIGNEVLHALTSRPSTLRVEAEDFLGDRRWGKWNDFSVADEHNKYQGIFAKYNHSSTLGDGLSPSAGSFFTTHDRDNDHQVVNCAVGTPYSRWGRGGWWYNACGAVRPTAPLIHTNYWDSACWQMFDKESKNITSLKSISMKFRRNDWYQQLDL